VIKVDKETLVKQAVDLDREVHRFLRRQSFRAWMNLDLTVPQIKTLFFVSNTEGANGRKLAAAMRVTPSNITGIVEKLVDQGLLSRVDNPEDRRYQLLRVTEKGETILNDLRERQVGSLREILDKLSVEELSRLVQGLFALARSAHERQEEIKNEYDRSSGVDA
jgi:MarR family transcriptional regulator, organic hydroperoxide resistance regulator